MEENSNNHLEELSIDENDSVYLKNNKNQIESLKLKYFGSKKKLSDKNNKFNQENMHKARRTLILKNKHNKNDLNLYSYKPKKKINKLFNYSISEESKKKEEISYESKSKKKNKIKLKVSKTFKNCGDNINKAKLLIFNKNSNKHRLSNKNSLISKKKIISNVKKSKKTNNKEAFYD